MNCDQHDAQFYTGLQRLTVGLVLYWALYSFIESSPRKKIDRYPWISLFLGLFLALVSRIETFASNPLVVDGVKRYYRCVFINTLKCFLFFSELAVCLVVRWTENTLTPYPPIYKHWEKPRPRGRDDDVCGRCKSHYFRSPLRNILPRPTVEPKTFRISNFLVPRRRESSFACVYWLESKVISITRKRQVG